MGGDPCGRPYSFSTKDVETHMLDFYRYPCYIAQKVRLFIRRFAMSGHTPWSEISTKMRADPERRVRIEQREQAIEAYLELYHRRRKIGKIYDTMILIIGFYY